MKCCKLGCGKRCIPANMPGKSQLSTYVSLFVRLLSICQSAWYASAHSVSLVASQSVSPLVSQSVSQSVSQTVRQSDSQSASQTVDRSVGQSVRPSVSMSASLNNALFFIITVCPNDKPFKLCIYDKCLSSPGCPGHPSARCRMNYCGECIAEYFDENGRKVDCSNGKNMHAIVCIEPRGIREMLLHIQLK